MPYIFLGLALNMEMFCFLALLILVFVFSDLTSAAVAKEALEGHCIYEGGYCRLHLSYSRHTDLSVKAYSDRSRDYTISDTSMIGTPQAPTLPTVSTGWQNNPQAAPVCANNDFRVITQAATPSGQTTTFGSVSPGQTILESSMPLQTTPAGYPNVLNGYLQTPQPMPHYGVRPTSAATMSQPPVYYS